MTNEEFKSFLDSIREKLGAEQSALISEDFLQILANYNGALEKVNSLESENAELKNTNEQLLKVNGQLYLKIGTPEDPKKEETKTLEEVSEDISEIIDEKGEII